MTPLSRLDAGLSLRQAKPAVKLKYEYFQCLRIIIRKRCDAKQIIGLDCAFGTNEHRNEDSMPIVNRVADLHAEITTWRRDIHAHPELLYDVHRTAASVAEKLKAFGCDEVVTGIGRTGVVGVIRGSRGGARKVIGLRADMDALPLQEANELPYKSTVPGKMHACGHDGHTAMLLGAA